MDEDFEKSLKEVIKKSRQLVRQTQELTAETKVLMEQYRQRKKEEDDYWRKKLGST